MLPGFDPDLQQATGGGAAIDLAVHDSGAGGHPLHVTGLENPAVAHGVAVVDLPLHHHGDDFHVAVGVHAEAFTGGNGVVVDHQ